MPGMQEGHMVHASVPCPPIGEWKMINNNWHFIIRLSIVGGEAVYAACGQKI